MKVVILAGGYGTRLSEETDKRPKPMVAVGTQPILWHIMNIYASQGFNEFVIALGYKGKMIEDYFLRNRFNVATTSFNKTSPINARLKSSQNNWTIHCVNTGVNTGTGGRLKKLSPLLKGETFMMTYGDGVSNINIVNELSFHRRHKKLVTMTAVRPPARFGRLKLQGARVTQFQEKPQLDEGWINGGFFIIEPKALKYISGTETMFERKPLETLAKNHQLMAYRHSGFWQCIDTLRDLRFINAMWKKGQAPWKIWKD